MIPYFLWGFWQVPGSLSAIRAIAGWVPRGWGALCGGDSQLDPRLGHAQPTGMYPGFANSWWFFSFGLCLGLFGSWVFGSSSNCKVSMGDFHIGCLDTKERGIRSSITEVQDSGIHHLKQCILSSARTSCSMWEDEKHPDGGGEVVEEHGHEMPLLRWEYQSIPWTNELLDGVDECEGGKESYVSTISPLELGRLGPSLIPLVYGSPWKMESREAFFFCACVPLILCVVLGVVALTW